MKIDRLETHDRFQHFVKGEFDISKTCQSIVDTRPFGDVPFYIFAHKREIGLDERYSLWLQMDPTTPFSDVPSARLIWQPRLTKPEAQENSMLFKAYSGSDNIKIIWIIPQRELWEQYERGNVTENSLVKESIELFKTDKKKLECKEDDDLPEETINRIYQELARRKVW
jgi:hypothetical protein